MGKSLVSCFLRHSVYLDNIHDHACDVICVRRRGQCHSLQAIDCTCCTRPCGGRAVSLHDT